MGENIITITVKGKDGAVLLQAELYDEYDAASLLTAWRRRNE